MSCDCEEMSENLSNVLFSFTISILRKCETEGVNVMSKGFSSSFIKSIDGKERMLRKWNLK